MDNLKILKQLITVLGDKNTPVRSLSMGTDKIVVDNKITLETIKRGNGEFIVRYNGKETIVSSLTLALDHIMKLLGEYQTFKAGDIVVDIDLGSRDEYMLIPIKDSTKQFYLFNLDEYKLLDTVMTSENLYNGGYLKLNI